MNLRSFKLYRVYLDLLNSSYVHVLHKTSPWEVSRRSRAVDVKELY